jgi:hypothetical protein
MYGVQKQIETLHLAEQTLYLVNYLKKKNNLICLIHIATYMLPFLFTEMNLIQLFLIAVQHYVQDRTQFVAWFCKITNKFQMDFNKFWGHVIVDNVIHILWMAFIANYFSFI